MPKARRLGIYAGPQHAPAGRLPIALDRRSLGSKHPGKKEPSRCRAGFVGASPPRASSRRSACSSSPVRRCSRRPPRPQPRSTKVTSREPRGRGLTPRCRRRTASSSWTRSATTDIAATCENGPTALFSNFTFAPPENRVRDGAFAITEDFGGAGLRSRRGRAGGRRQGGGDLQAAGHVRSADGHLQDRQARVGGEEALTRRPLGGKGPGDRPGGKGDEPRIADPRDPEPGAGRVRVSAATAERPTALVSDLLREFLPFPPRRAHCPSRPRPTGPDPYGNPDPGVAADRLARAPAPRSRSSRSRAVNYARDRAPDDRAPECEGRRQSVRARALRRPGRTGSRTSPTSPARHRVIALDLPGLRALARAALGDLDRGLRAPACTASATRSTSASASWSATRWAASSSPRPSSKGPTASTGWCSSRPPGVSHARHARAGPPETAARMVTAIAPLMLTAPGAGAAAGRAALARLPRRVPRPCSFAPSCSRSSSTTAPAGRACCRPSQGLVGYDFLDRLEDVELPDADRLGPQRPHRPAHRRRGYGRRLRNSRTVIFDRHRPRADGRAAGPLQPGPEASWRSSGYLGDPEAAPSHPADRLARDGRPPRPTRPPARTWPSRRLA